MCSVEDKILEVVLKDGMIGQTINQTHEPRLAQDFSWKWWQYEDNFEMMLENECSCTLSKMFSLKIHSFLW